MQEGRPKGGLLRACYDIHMFGPESFAKDRSEREKREELVPATVDDFGDMPQVQSMLHRLPPELQAIHAARISDMDEEHAFEYLFNLLDRRESAVREFVVSDESVSFYFHAHEREIWKDLETRVFTDPDNFLGSGQTARVKRYGLSNEKTKEKIPLAVKYLLTPTEKTLSVSGEHDLIREVERVHAIEEAEHEIHADDLRIRVPHPYFYYKNEKIQCYGMEYIDGITLEQGMKGDYDPAFKEALLQNLQALDREVLFGEVDLFFDAVHHVCLHGDIKPANIMVSREGKFYVIDFGQSILAHEISDKDAWAFEMLKEDEKKGTKDSIRFFLNALEG